MTIAETVAHFARYAATKDTALSADPMGFALSAMKAGAYVGIGIILIFTLGRTADPSPRGWALRHNQHGEPEGAMRERFLAMMLPAQKAR